jgi:sec-independent protein translocase protein TatA
MMTPSGQGRVSSILEHLTSFLYASFRRELPERVQLALVGFEAIIVVVLIIVVFLWGPQKLPEIARSVALAKREFDKVSKELGAPLTSSPSQPSTPAPTSTSTAAAVDPIIVAAKALGITTEGKTKEEIAREIAAR